MVGCDCNRCEHKRAVERARDRRRRGRPCDRDLGGRTWGRYGNKNDRDERDPLHTLTRTELLTARGYPL